MNVSKDALRASMVICALLVASARCSSSDDTGGATGDDGGAGQDGSGGPGSDASNDSGPRPTGDGGTDGGEPSYLRNDALAGFAFTANFGSPYDSILGAPLDTTQSAIAPGFTTAPGAGQIVASQRFQLIANSEDLYSALDISASLSVSTGLASVNAKTHFAQSTQIDSTDLWVLADLSQMGTSQKIVSPTISAEAAALSPEQFYSLYGDRYAAEIVTGAEMFCTIQIHTFSQEDKSSLSASLGFSYGASSGSASFINTVQSKTANRSVVVSCQELGFTPKTLVQDLPTLIDAANAFQSGGAGTLGNVTTSTLFLLYTSYYGLPGYPGVPAGTDAKVAQQAQIASDYLLYNSLVSNDFAAYYADANDAALPFFAHMKSYRDALSQFVTATIANSQSPGVAVPAPQADGVITDWVTAKTAASTTGATPQFTAYGIANGVVPKRISDYAIPLRYAYPDAAGNGTLKGVTFAPVKAIPAVATLASTQPVDYQLYLVDKTGTGGGLWLEYQWDTGTYAFTNVTTAAGTPNPTAIAAAIAGPVVAGMETTAYAIVNKANGMALTDNGTSAPMTASHFTSGNKQQLWKFYVDAGGTIANCTTYVAPGAAAGVGCSTGNNYPVSVANNPPCGSLVFGISSAALAASTSGYWSVNNSGASGSTIASNGGAGCSNCNTGCGGGGCAYSNCGGGPEPFDNFFFAPFDNGTTRAIYNYAASPGNVVSYMVSDPTETAQNLPPPPIGPGSDAGAANVESIVVGANDGHANELWVFIPESNIDGTP